MAANFGDEAHSRLVEKTATDALPKKLSSRKVNLALYELSYYYPDISVPNDYSYLKRFIEYEDLSHEEVNKLMFLVESSIVSDESISWIEDSLRVAIWFNHYYFYIDGKVNKNWGNFSSDFKKNLILSFDTACIITRRNNIRDYQYHAKRELIIESKNLYNTMQTNPKDLKWLDSENEEQLLWTTEYLRTKGYLLHPPLFIPITKKELYAQILASLDAIDIYARLNRQPYAMSLEKKDLLRSIRNAWSQKKFRDSKDAKNALEYIFSDTYLNKLKRLANSEKMSTTEYLEYLIDMAD